ncbi:MAG: hypothetical protein WBF37_10635 [Dehalococcoidia bacterium]
MKAYLPSKFLQVTLHQKGCNPARLGTLLALLIELNFEPALGIDILTIAYPGLLLLPTRQCKFPFEDNEIRFIRDFISQGNPLFHLSNHYPLTKQDTVLGQEFGYRFHDVVKGFNKHRNFNVYPLSNPTSIFHSLDAKMHFKIHNSSIVSDDSDTFITIADFSRSDISTGDRNAAFGIARPRNLETGAIVALGDSGLLGEPSPCYPDNPGPGLNVGNNLDLVTRILLWLRNQTV